METPGAASASPRGCPSTTHFSCPSRSTPPEVDLPDELVSAVDIYRGGVPVFSRAFETDTSARWFQSSPFAIELAVSVADAEVDELSLCWIVMNLAKGRVVNLSSRRAVAVERRWRPPWLSDKGMVARFLTAVGGCEVATTVKWRRGKGDVMGAAITVENRDGALISGAEGLRRVMAAMEGKGEAEKKYSEYLRLMGSIEGRSNKRKWSLLGVCLTVVAASAFLPVCCLMIKIMNYEEEHLR